MGGRVFCGFSFCQWTPENEINEEQIMDEVRKIMSKGPTSESSAKHKAFASQKGPISAAVVTVSDSRTPDTDANAQYLREQLKSSGHHLGEYRLIKDEADQVETALDELSDSDVQIIIFNGGTGISRRDRTFDVINRKLEKELPGFGELFRMLSYDQVGSSAMFSRATAGVFKGKVIISIPGSNAAVRLAWEKLILPELQHLAWEVVR